MAGRYAGRHGIRKRASADASVARESAHEPRLHAAVWALQAAAGNRAVAGLLGASRIAQRESAPGSTPPSTPTPAGNDTDLMDPDEGATSTTATPTTGAAGGQSPAGAGAGAGSFELQLFRQSVSTPLQASVDLARADPPDFEAVAAQMRPMGGALANYEDRYRGRDDGLANHFLAMRGWMGQPYREIQRRLGSDAPKSDKQIADAIADMQIDTNQIETQLRG